MLVTLRRYLERASPGVVATVAGLAGGRAYFSMYAFGKPFSAATYPVVSGWPDALDYRIALVITQVLGAAVAELIGTKVVSNLGSARREMSSTA